MSRRNRERRPGRRDPYRKPKPIILIVCEGKRTEPESFLGFSKANRNPRVDIRIAPERGVPLTLVKTANSYKRGATRLARGSRDVNLLYDSVWCVFDVDDHPNIPAARDLARTVGIRLAISNPCFELWLLLHFRGDPGPQDRATISRMLDEIVRDYDKGVDYSVYADGYERAKMRAENLVEAAENANDAGRNPTTDVFKLTELIKGKPPPAASG